MRHIPLLAAPSGRNTKRAISVGVLVSLALVTIIAGCGGDDSSPTSTPNMADVNTYVSDLNPWPDTLTDSDGPTGGADDGTEAVNGTTYDCSTTPYSITQTPDKIVVFDPDDEIFWLGALLQGNGFRGGLGSLSELPVRQRAPLQISIDILGEGTTRTVASPSPTAVNGAIGELITLAENSGQTFASDILFSQTETYSVEQSAIKMGLSAHYLGGQVSASLDYSQNAAQNTVSAYFLQKMFTTSMTLPQLPSDVFSADFTAERLQEQVDLGRIGPDNQPAYISSIVWGRLMMLTITSSSSVTEIQAALSASYSSAGNGGSGSVDAASLSLLQQSSIQLVTIGGDQSAALSYLRTGQLSQFFAEDAPLTSAVPLSFTVRDLQTNEKALVSETTTYNVRTCAPAVIDPIGAKYRVKLDSFYIANGNCDGGGYFDAYWSVTAGGTPPSTTSRSASQDLDVYNNTVVAVTTSWSGWVDVMDNGTGAITINGSMYDWDTISDDHIASWDVTLSATSVPAIAAGSFAVSGGSPAGETCRVDLRYTIEKGAFIYP